MGFRQVVPSRLGLRAFAAAVLVTVLSAAPAMRAQTPTAGGGGSRTATLEQRLTFGLQARRPQEIAFVKAVVDTVGRGKLPVRLVDRTFFWARNRAPKVAGEFVRRPIIYFRPALLAQTNRLGIAVRANPAPPTP